MAHTPGPWTRHEKGKHPHPFICGAPEDTEWGKQEYVVVYLVGANIEANARLISAAPDLLEALKEAREMVEAWAGYASDYFRDKHDLAGDLAKIDAAIAKATGE